MCALGCAHQSTYDVLILKHICAHICTILSAHMCTYDTHDVPVSCRAHVCTYVYWAVLQLPGWKGWQSAGLHEGQTLAVLDLSGNQFDEEECAVVLSKVFAKCKGLQHLHLQ